MSFGQAVLVGYAALMLVGGIMGYRAAGSAKSMIAGVGSAAFLLIAYVVSRSNPAAGFWIGAVVSLALCIVFGIRLAKTRKPMPAGALLVVSVIAFVLLVLSATAMLR